MGQKRDRVQAILDVTSQEVARLGLAERRDLFIVLRRAELELAAGLREWLKNAPDGAERFTAVHMRNALAHVSVALETIRTMNPIMVEVLDRNMNIAAELAVNHVSQQYTALVQVFEGELRTPNIDVASALSRPGKLLIDKHKKSARRYAGDSIKHIRRQLAVGVVKGESWDQMSSRLMRLGPKEGLGPAVKPALADRANEMARGVMQLPRTQAERIVRTEAVNSYNAFHLESIRELAEDDPQIKKRWDTTLDRRNKKCLFCPPLDGQTRELDEPFEIRGQKFDHPPAHPNCRCTTVPWSDDWKHDSKQSTGTEAINAPDPKPLTDRREERASAR